MNTKDITCLVISAILFLFSIQYHRGKWYGSLAGYNALPKDAREYIDIRPYVQRASMSSFSMGLLLLTFAFEWWLREVNPIIFDVVLCFSSIFARITFFRMVKYIIMNGRQRRQTRIFASKSTTKREFLESAGNRLFSGGFSRKNDVQWWFFRNLSVQW